jgi:S-sulfo-L-cysteine synthase (O-acetyl-L-serine-dependent)
MTQSSTRTAASHSAVNHLRGEAILAAIGNTPLLPLNALLNSAQLNSATGGESHRAQFFGKAEWYNPGGSVKDRAAASIVDAARRSGKLTPGKILLDSTSGNTGIAYAMLGAALGFPVTLCVPENVSPERKRILQAYGANIIYTDPAEGSDGAIKIARQLAAHHPDLYFYADQYSNDANWRAHYETTANEIWQQTQGRITHFVAMLGTTGTFVGTTRRLKELNPKVRCISLQPDSAFHGIEGAKHLPSAIVPRIYDASLADENLEISTEDAHSMARRLAREQGLLLGVSAAAAIVGSLKVIDELSGASRNSSQTSGDRGVRDGATVVTILCDSGEKYLSERFWSESGLEILD